MTRISATYAKLKAENRKAFTTYICAGDPDFETSLDILKSLPEAGADLIELGIPFLDPAGDGPIIEDASRRAIDNGMTLARTLEMVKEFRQTNDTTPIILMGYFNPILKYGLNKIFKDAKQNGVDGFLIVDLPLEEEVEINKQIEESQLDLIKLIAPTTSKERAHEILNNASGFIYLISMLGITGTKNADVDSNISNINFLKEISQLPLAIGFGIKNPEMASQFCQTDIDGIVVGSTLVAKIEDMLKNNEEKSNFSQEIAKITRQFSNEIRNA